MKPSSKWAPTTPASKFHSFIYRRPTGHCRNLFTRLFACSLRSLLSTGRLQRIIRWAQTKVLRRFSVSHTAKCLLIQRPSRLSHVDNHCLVLASSSWSHGDSRGDIDSICRKTGSSIPREDSSSGTSSQDQSMHRLPHLPILPVHGLAPAPDLHPADDFPSTALPVTTCWTGRGGRPADHPIWFGAGGGRRQLFAAMLQGIQIMWHRTDHANDPVHVGGMTTRIPWQADSYLRLARRVCQGRVKVLF